MDWPFVVAMVSFLLRVGPPKKDKKTQMCQTFVWSYEPQASNSVKFDNDYDVIFMFKM